MKRAAIYAVLIALVLDGNPAASPARALGAEKAMGIPWVVHMEYGGFSLLQAPPKLSGDAGYQLRMVHGVTVQPWRPLTLHASWRYRETLAPGFDSPYREPVGVQGAFIFEFLPDMLYGWIGASGPLWPSQADVKDSLAWDELLSGKTAMPDPALVNPASLQGGGLWRLRSGKNSLMAGLSYTQPASFSAFEETPFRPPWILRLSVRFSRALWDARQAMDMHAWIFGPELSADGKDAHSEGYAIRLRYTAEGLGTEGLWAAGARVTLKLPDANRHDLIGSPLVAVTTNDNDQRAAFDVARAFKKKVFRFQIALSDGSSVRWNKAENSTYFENALDMRLSRFLTGGHSLGIRTELLVGTDLTSIYYGIGCRFLFTLRHLAPKEMDHGGEAP